MDYQKGIIILTDKGKEELKTPKNLKMEERSLLVMVDCSSTGEQLLEKAKGYPNAEQILEKLLADDYLSITSEVPKKEKQVTIHAELRQAAIDVWRRRKEEIEQGGDPPHDPETGEVVDAKYEDVGPPAWTDGDEPTDNG